MNCERCGCYLDFGDMSERMDEAVCVSCDLILGGMDPFKAMLEASCVKRDRLAEREANKFAERTAP